MCDVGGGKSPIIDLDTKRRLNITLVGIDVDQDELDLAPPDAYDKAICADICDYAGSGDADLIICQAVLEHLPDVEAAFRSMSSILKPGGRALIFTPSKNALFARLNKWMPEKIKKTLLFGLTPETRRNRASEHTTTGARRTTSAGWPRAVGLRWRKSAFIM